MANTNIFETKLIDFAGLQAYHNHISGNIDSVNDKVDELRNDFDELVSGDTASTIDNFNEIVAFLKGIEDSTDLDSIIASIEQQIADRKAYELVDLGSLSKGSNNSNDYYTIDASVYTTLNEIWSKGVLPLCKVTLNNDTTSISFLVIKHNDNNFIGYAHKQLGGLLHFSLYVDASGGKIYSHYEQEKLKSGENIKTIDGESILGSGDLDVKIAGEFDILNKVFGDNIEQFDMSYSEINEALGVLIDEVKLNDGAEEANMINENSDEINYIDCSYNYINEALDAIINDIK